MSKLVGTCWILCVRQNIGEDLNRNAVVVYELLGNSFSNPSATKIDYIAFGMSKWVGILWINLLCHKIAKGVYRNAVAVDGNVGNHLLRYFTKYSGCHRVRHVQTSGKTLNSISLWQKSERPSSWRSGGRRTFRKPQFQTLQQNRLLASSSACAN